MSDAPERGTGQTRASIGLDIGGSLAKVVYFEPDGIDLENRETKRMRDFIFKTTRYGATGYRETSHSIYSPDLEGTMHFIKFQTSHVRGAVEMMKEAGLTGSSSEVYATGGGAMKFADMIRDQLGLTMQKADELECLIVGMSWLCHNVPQELYRIEGFKFSQTMQRVPHDIGESLFPFLVVNIGSGVSMLHVTSPTSYERVGGTSLGGATFYGLVSLLTDCSSFEEALDLAEQGDNKRVDMLVRDIYGGDYEAFNLRGTAVASSFGKMLRPSFRRKAASADLARATLLMITNNIGSIAHMHAKSMGTTRIIFSGNFLLKNRIAHRTLSYATHFWSGGERRALFLRHEGYCGAVGALLRGFNPPPRSETPTDGTVRARAPSIGMAPRPELVRIESRNVLETQRTAADRYMEALSSAHSGSGEGESRPYTTSTHRDPSARCSSASDGSSFARPSPTASELAEGPPASSETASERASVGIALEEFHDPERQSRARNARSRYSHAGQGGLPKSSRGIGGESRPCGAAPGAVERSGLVRPASLRQWRDEHSTSVNRATDSDAVARGSAARAQFAPTPPLRTGTSVAPLRFPASTSHDRDLYNARNSGGASGHPPSESPRWSTQAAQLGAASGGDVRDASPIVSTPVTIGTASGSLGALTPLFGHPHHISGLPVGAPRAVWIDPSAQELNPRGSGRIEPPPDASAPPGSVAAWARQVSSGEVELKK